MGVFGGEAAGEASEKGGAVGFEGDGGETATEWGGEGGVVWGSGIEVAGVFDEVGDAIAVWVIVFADGAVDEPEGGVEVFGDPLPIGSNGEVVDGEGAGDGVGFAGALIEGEVEGDGVEAEGAEAHVGMSVVASEDEVFVGRVDAILA